MKVLIGAVAAAALMLGSAAEAQTATTTAVAPAPTVAPSRCPNAIAPPTIPDGATVTQADMGTANDAFRAWAQAMQEIVHCRHAEYDDNVATVHARENEYNAIRDSLNGTIQSWTTASETFCARRGMHCTNDTAQQGAHH